MPHEVGLQVAHRVDIEMSQEKTVLGIAASTRASTARAGYAQRGRDTGRAIADRARAHTHLHSAKVCSVTGSGLHQEKECALHSPELPGTAKELQRTTLLYYSKKIVYSQARQKAGDYPYLKECLDMGKCRHISPQDMGEPAFTVPNGLVGNPQRRGKVSQSYLDSPHLLW